MPANDCACVHADSGKADTDKLSQPSPKPLSQLTSSPPLDMDSDRPIPDTNLSQGVRLCVCVRAWCGVCVSVVCVCVCVYVCVCMHQICPLGMLALESFGLLSSSKAKKL